jgi:hypothetical protein
VRRRRTCVGVQPHPDAYCRAANSRDGHRPTIPFDHFASSPRRSFLSVLQLQSLPVTQTVGVNAVKSEGASNGLQQEGNGVNMPVLLEKPDVERFVRRIRFGHSSSTSMPPAQAATASTQPTLLSNYFRVPLNNSMLFAPTVELADTRHNGVFNFRSAAADGLDRVFGAAENLFGAGAQLPFVRGLVWVCAEPILWCKRVHTKGYTGPRMSGAAGYMLA